ncbi:MAG: 2-C-methyl-D-erythritol 4-phosphate cytidylyltransferase [Dehalococcoidia bacterium]
MTELQRRTGRVRQAKAIPSEPLPIASAIIVAAGHSSRMAGRNKLFLDLAGRPLLRHTLAAFEACPAINHIMLVLSLEAAEPGLQLLQEAGFHKVDGTCLGGETRQESVYAGLQALRACEWVVVHDAARPLVTPELIEAGIAAAQQTGAATAGQPIVDTLKEADSDGSILWTVPRERLWAVQTPQVFRFELLLSAHEQQHLQATDDAGMVEHLGIRVRLYQGSPQNLKVTSPEDVALAEALLRLRRAGSE